VAGSDPSSKLEESTAEAQLRRGTSLSWKNLEYRVGERRILAAINGFIRPGMLLALMGPSGAGKSTLLDVLALRKTSGTVEGEITFGGHPLPKSYKRCIGYVEQFDVHYPLATVLEAVTFAANSRLPASVSATERTAIINSIIDLMDLRPVLGHLIGEVTKGGLNPEQRKRLTIAVELAGDPQILFLDEPTSGLDALGARKVFSAVQKVAQMGKSVICTIHQPSQRVFELATHLLVLRSGGRVSYFGPLGEHTHTVLQYFQQHLGAVCPPKTNPADFVIGVVGNPKLTQEDSAELYGRSPLAQTMAAEQASLPVDEVSVLESDTREFSQGFGWQVWALSVRFFKGWLRATDSFYLALARALLLGLIFGTAFWQRNLDQAGSIQLVSALFFSSVLANLNAFSMIPVTTLLQPVFLRETAESMYSAWAFGVARIVVSYLIALTVPTVFGIPFYWMSGLRQEAGPFFTYMLALYGIFLACVSLSLALSQIMPNEELASLVFSLSFSFFALSAGFLLPKGKLHWWIWSYWISVIHWYLEPVVVNNFRGVTLYCTDNQLVPVEVSLANGSTAVRQFCPLTSGDQFLASFDMNKNLLWPDIAVLWGYCFVFSTIYFVALRYINWTKR
jgi:ABC-type multidrug transport system ATPase subunit/ABC-type multidrug transport system permease subunit